MFILNENHCENQHTENKEEDSEMIIRVIRSAKNKSKTIKMFYSGWDDGKAEKKAIKNCVKRMKLIPNKEEMINLKTNRLGSLYQLFKSEYFDIHLLICYLDKKEEQGIIDTLVNLMHEIFTNESFFYIPQLCTMITYKSYYESLENYILDRCVDQMKFSLKVHWLISSYTDHSDVKIIKKYDKLIQRIEMTLVNGRRATLSSFRLYNSMNIRTDEEVYKHSLDKESRLNYFDKVMRFYYDLKAMCEKLKDIPKENKLEPKMTRNAVMRNYLKNFNRNIKKMYGTLDENNSETTTKSFFRGYILPFDDSTSTEDDYNSLIVNLLPEHSFCFSTKARVPVKITVETVRVLECAYWDELYEESSSRINEEEILKTEENGGECPNCGGVNCNCNENPFSTSNRVNTNGNSNGTGSNPQSSNQLMIVEYSSIDDFFKKLGKTNEETKQREKENEIKQIVENIKQANENGNYSPRPSLLKLKTRESIISEFNQLHKEENFLFDNSEGTINPFGSKWSDSVKQIKDKSRFKNFETYSVKSFIAKANDDLRQEVMTMQLIKRFNDVFTKADIPLKLRPYEILITSPSSGLIEFLPNTISIDALKKNLPLKWNLDIFFRKFFTNNFEEAQKNFAESLAAYSLVTYIINIKDRHNGNILLDMNGNIIHIDFGFILGISPGNLNFENAPFKLTTVNIILILTRNMLKYWMDLNRIFSITSRV